MEAKQPPHQEQMVLHTITKKETLKTETLLLASGEKPLLADPNEKKKTLPNPKKKLPPSPGV